MNNTLVLNRRRPSTLTSKMDISTFLNPSEELDQETEAMEVDSPTPTSYPPQNLPESSPSIQRSPPTSPSSTHVYLHTFPPMQLRQQPATSDPPHSDNTLPPLRFLFQNITPHTLAKREGHKGYYTQTAIQEVQDRKSVV